MLRKSVASVDRQEKNAMRQKLETVLEAHQKIQKSISQFKDDTSEPSYCHFWNELDQRNNESIQIVSKYMVNRCNR